MIYLYGLIEGGNAPALEPPVGVTGPVEVAALGQDQLIYGPGSEDEILPKRRNLLAHTRVLEHYGTQHNILPMRFGMTSPSLDRVGHLVTSQRKDIDAAFDKLRGCVELGVRVTYPEDPALTATLGADPALAAERARLGRFARPPHFETAEFGRRLGEAMDRRRQRAQRQLVDRIAPLCRTYVLRAPEEETQVLAMDVVVARTEQDHLAHVLAEVLDTVDFAPGAEPSVRIVGPIPAYSFVRLSLGDIEAEAA
jgi:hypothetical protein